jgi:hypothetical protein
VIFLVARPVRNLAVLAAVIPTKATSPSRGHYGGCKRKEYIVPLNSQV